MTTFWIIAGALAVVATLFVALPLMKSHTEPGNGGSGTELNVSVYREQLSELEGDRGAGRLGADQYEQARAEIERRLLEELPDADQYLAVPARRGPPAAALAAGFVVPLVAGLMYVALGNPASLWPRQGAGQDSVGPHQLDATIGQRAARLEKNPEAGKGWVLLARSQAVLGRFGEASSAYARSVAIFPDDAQLLADYADTLATVRGGRLQGEPKKLVERALRVDPNNAKALALAGTIRFDDKDFAMAVNYWQRLQGLIPADSEFAKSLQKSIAEAKSLAGGIARQAAEAPGEPQAQVSR